jgi:hypothetical protein
LTTFEKLGEKSEEWQIEQTKNYDNFKNACQRIENRRQPDKLLFSLFLALLIFFR